jgi:hypothetical protein
MIGGTVQSWTAHGSVVTFLVKETESESTCYVKAKMNSFAQKFIETGVDIWWDSDKVYIQFDDVPDCKFDKIGYSF